ncbi:MAG: ATPase [Epsilonproteobacteria bacterium]|nr:ATPase [Campylobacterota bacterium]
MNVSLGHIIEGSISEGFTMRVAQGTDLENIKAGKFVAIKGSENTFFSMITNVKLQVSHPDILLYPPTEKEALLKEFLKKKSMYATVQLKPMILLDKHRQTKPVKTVPPHFAQVFEATEQDVADIFGSEKDTAKKYFNMGSPLDMQAPVCIDLAKLSERSSGIFGKSGTGKTFLTRLVLAGLIKRQAATTLIFDMHNEYGLQARQESQIKFVKGLKTLFPSKVAIFSLDPQATQRRGAAPDVAVQLSYKDIRIEDILSLQSELNLHNTALEAAHLIFNKYKEDWLLELLENGHDAQEFAKGIGAHPESVAALYRKLKRIERLPFFVKNLPRNESVIDRLLEYLDKQIHVIFEFGNFTSTFCYLLMANIITRRIHHEYVLKTEKFLGTQKAQDEPEKLMIVIEEAHKFLNPSAASQTIFGIIAREMRKYYVSLFVIDQRPSGIDPEVISQIGTKLIAQLSDERDIQAALTGASNVGTLKTVLGSLDTKKQALVLGHAIAMPIVIETRTYDEQFYQAMQQGTIAAKSLDTVIDELF